MSMSLRGATIAALAKCFTDKSLWGSRGEGIAHYQNSMATLGFALPYLLTKDKEGWLNACEEYKKQKEEERSESTK